MHQSTKAIVKNILINQLRYKEEELRMVKGLASHYWNRISKLDPNTQRYFELFNSYRNDIRKLSRIIKSIKIALKEIKHA